MFLQQPYFLSRLSLVLFGILGSTQTLQAQLQPTQIAARAKQGTVQIRTLNARNEVIKTGSGIIVTEDGIIVTNFHLVQGGVALQVELPNNEIYDNVFYITADPRRDLIIIKVPAESLKPLPLGNDLEAEVGEKVYVMGNPLGMTNTFSDGLVSAKRTVDGVSMLQISAPISPGSSGGPVMNGNGEVIGIATMGMRGGQNLNYAVPVHYIRPLLSTGERPVRFNAALLPRTGGGLTTTDNSVPNINSSPRPTTSNPRRDEWDAQVNTYLSDADEALSKMGFVRSHAIGSGALEARKNKRYNVQLDGRRRYAIVAVCDDDCSDIDLYLYDRFGDLKGRDIKNDDRPFVIIRPTVTTEYTVQVTMVSCSVGPCRFGVAIYVER